MKNFLNRIFENHSLIFKMIVYILSVIAIVYLFPRNGQFKYQFQKGKVWNYDDFYAPFDFSLEKSSEELEIETKEILKNKDFFFKSQDSVIENVTRKLHKEAQKNLPQDLQNSESFEIGLQKLHQLVSTLYDKGYIAYSDKYRDQNLNNFQIKIIKGNETSEYYFHDFFNDQSKLNTIENVFIDYPNPQDKLKWIALADKMIVPNIFFDANLTDLFHKNQLNSIIPYKGFIAKGTKIISKGEVVEIEQFNQLSAINKQYDTLIWSQKNFYWLLIAYIVLVAIVLMMLLLFINRYRPDVGDNVSKVTFLFANMFLMVLITMLVLKYNVKYLYIIPYTLLPLLIKAFLDPRLGLFTHVMTVLLLGFLVPNSFEFVFVQLTAGVVTILTVSELNKRANLFLSVAKITGVYLLTFIAFTITREGSIDELNTLNYYLFIFNGLLTASLIVPLIFVYEKIFGLVSDETLREFSDTNNKLLKELNEKAPGTFQHSMQVANLVEDSCKEIGANALLARTGAMYHDIGKIYNSSYFVENQSTSVNPHSELDPEESAKIIIDHVLLGIALAKKNNIPDRVIDFIRTHHGTNLVYYFYKKEEEYNPEATDINKFRYPGPIPFSKETAIVMICDACEAASKSLKEPTAKTIDLFVDKIVKNQMENGQYQNADITFREIEKVKKVVKKKLKNIYHIRIEYPE